MVALSSPNIRVRNIRPDFEKDVRRHWFGGNAFTSHMIHALSFQFPPGEAMFVRSVNHYRDKITDPQLRKAIRAFAAQESLHSKYHDEFNQWVAQRVPEAQAYCEAITQQIDGLYDRHAKKNPLTNLAITVALEHMTAIMARTFLRRSDILDKIDPQVRALLIWHAIEEIEHRAVAFDVFQTVSGSYRVRVLALIMATMGLFLTTAFYQCKLLFRDGELFHGRAALEHLSTTFGRNGFFTVLLGSYFDFFRRDFHPLQHQDNELIEEWSHKLKDLVPVQIMGKSDAEGEAKGVPA